MRMQSILIQESVIVQINEYFSIMGFGLYAETFYYYQCSFEV